MVVLQFNDRNAQAWFRSCLHRAAAIKSDTDPKESMVLMDIRELSYGWDVILFKTETQIVLSACEDRVGNDPSFAEARQDLVDQLKKGLK